MTTLLDARPTTPATGRRRSRPSLAATVAALGVLAMAAVVLARHAALLEPDDFAYRASIVALAKGEVLLSGAQYHALVRALAHLHPAGIAQWHHERAGWISEKNPGYPFLAVGFYLAHALRLAPLAFGALGALGLYHGARAWAGRWAGTVAVWVYCFSGAALVFAWRATMPSFTDASLVAAGAGLLLWTMLSADAPARRRALVGLGGFVALELAVAVRYTDLVELAVALVAVVAFARPARLRASSLALWAGSALAAGAALFAFDAWAYGSAASTGYSPGEITFSLSAIAGNLHSMPLALLETMPALVVAAVALGVVGARLARRPGDPAARRDGAVALVLALAWIGLWAWYLTYTWTEHAGFGGLAGAVHVIRFYLPALGPIALLSAWALTRGLAGLGPRTRAGAATLVVATLVALALSTFPALASGAGPGGAPGGLHGPRAGLPGGALPGGAVPGGPPGLGRPGAGRPPHGRPDAPLARRNPAGGGASAATVSP